MKGEIGFQARNRHTKQEKKKQCQSDLPIGKGLSKLLIVLGKMSDFGEQLTFFIASYEVKSSLYYHCVPVEVSFHLIF